MFTLGIATVSWKFLKQMVIAKFIVEFEFITLETCGEKVERLHQFLYDISRWLKPMPPIRIHCDSQSAIGRAQSCMYNGMSRHIRHKHNTISQLELSLWIFVKSKNNIEDPLTKGLNGELVENSLKGM